MLRLLILCHRYLGIAAGALMVSWCASGVVMMYVSYPALDQDRRLSQLAPISWSGCCTIGDELSSAAVVQDLSIETLQGRPVLRLAGAGSRPQLIDLITGSSIGAISVTQAASVASSCAGTPQSAAPALLGLIQYDQWTVDGGFDAERPLYRFGLGDPRRTEVYVSSTSGRAVQLTTGRERFWNWLGAVPHWLYFARLRRHAALWSQVVIVSSLLGCFLSVFGIYIGALQFLRRPRGRWSPYRGLNLWHHLAGLLFGIFTLTWVLSGLLSMNPWGWLEGAGASPERTVLRGKALSGAQLRAALHALADAQPANLVSIRMAPLNARLYFIATGADGQRRRLDELGHAAPLSEDDLAYIGVTLAGSWPADALQLITHEQTYYFNHHSDKVRLPAYRLGMHDGSGTLYYLDPVTGELLAKIDRGAQGYRWWHEGLHRLDFVPALRARPQWDVLMLVLMSGVMATCFAGAYLGYRRLTR